MEHIWEPNCSRKWAKDNTGPGGHVSVTGECTRRRLHTEETEGSILLEVVDVKMLVLVSVSCCLVTLCLSRESRNTKSPLATVLDH